MIVLGIALLVIACMVMWFVFSKNKGINMHSHLSELLCLSMKDTISAADFRKLTNKHLAPRLRQNGWKGSGSDFKKVVGDFIHLLKVEFYKNGGQVRLEIGVHPMFLKDTNGYEYDLKKLVTWDVDIRTHLKPKGKNNYGWSLKKDERGNIAVIEQMLALFEQEAPALFNKFTELPGLFGQFNSGDLVTLKNAPYVKGVPFGNRPAWILAQVFEYLGDYQKVIDFCDFGISQIEGNRGLDLKPAYERMRQNAVLSLQG